MPRPPTPPSAFSTSSVPAVDVLVGNVQLEEPVTAS
jgi:hypothetical protein